MSLFTEPHFIIIQVEQLIQAVNGESVEEVIIDDGNDLKALMDTFKTIRVNSHTDVYSDKEMIVYFKLLNNITQKPILSSYSTAVMNTLYINNQKNNQNEDL